MTEREREQVHAVTTTTSRSSVPVARRDQETVRVGIYARISRDPSGQALGVERQERHCRELCEREGWTIAEVYTDNDISAYAGSPRPRYDRMLSDYASGHIDRIVVWHIDRITRSVREFEDLVDLGLTVTTVQSGSVSLDNAAGIAVARTLIAWGRYESDHKRDRILLKHLDKAQAGEWFGTACYGYTKDGKIVPEQAAIIKELAQRFIAGESLRSLTAWLNESGVPTFGKTNAKKRAEGEASLWRSTTLRSMLASAKLSGQREHTPRAKTKAIREARKREIKEAEERRRPIKRENLTPIPFGTIVAEGNWEAILTPAQTEQIRARLLQPERKTAVLRVHLLSGGLIFCARCRKPMNRRSGSNKKAGDKDRYQCIREAGIPAGTPGFRCGSMSIIAEATEQYVCDYVLKSLLDSRYQPNALPNYDEDDVQDARDEIAAIAIRRTDLTNAYTDGLVPLPQYRKGMERLNSLEEDAKTLISEAHQVSEVEEMTAGWHDLEEWWRGTTLEQKRSVIAALTDGIFIHPAASTSPYYDSSRVEVVLKH